jgi:hypothetical protein
LSIFGQNPADITGAVFKSKNFSDIPDKAAARNNLNVPSKDEVLYNSVPVGMILPYWGSVAPAGYLPCSGQTVTSGTFPELVAFLGGGASQVIPDLRGEFLRGWDNGRGTDLGRAIKTAQDAQTEDHSHVTPVNDTASLVNIQIARGTGSWPYGSSSGILVGTNTITSGVSYISSGEDSWLNTGPNIKLTAGETRPRNVSVLYCIKAYSSVANYTSSVNIAGLISDYSTLNSAAVKYADFLGSNQQVLSSGYQKLPGGIILQWIPVAMPTTASASTAFTYPIAFPTAVATLALASNHTMSTAGIVGLTINNRNNSGASLMCTGFTGTIGAVVATTVIAIGY